MRSDRPNLSYMSSYWPVRTNKDDTSKKESLDNLNKSLTDHMHDRNRLGYSNTSSVYYQAWQRIRTQADTEISNKLLNHPSISSGPRRVALMYRHGTLWNNKAAKRCHMSSTANCPLCGQLDGVNHIAGGCRHTTMERMYTSRHNSTGRLLLRAISKGDMGSDLVMADLGSAEKCQKAGAPPLPRCPEELKAFLLKPHAHNSRPDAIIMHTDKRSIYLIEFKYCKDTQPEDQLEACKLQHATLISDLTTAGYAVHLVPILIGHSGTIYTTHTLTNMTQLGISLFHARKCAQKMHIDAVTQLHSIVQTRRQHEHNTNTHMSTDTKRKPTTRCHKYKPP